MIQVRHKKRMGAEDLAFYHPSLLCCPDQMLAVMELSHHLVLSSKTVKPIVRYTSWFTGGPGRGSNQLSQSFSPISNALASIDLFRDSSCVAATVDLPNRRSGGV